MQFDLTVCIVAYNNYKDIKKAIDSMQKYTSKTIRKKVYIVDNGSKIAEVEVKEDFLKYISKYKDVEYIDVKQNLGFGKGHNVVLNMINSRYHAIVNPDIEFVEDSFEKIITWMDNMPDAGMVIPKIVDAEGNLQKVYRNEITVFDVFIRFFCKGLFKKRQERHTLQNMDYSKPFVVPFGQGSFLVIKTDLFKELGGFDDGYFMYVEDADICKRVNQMSKLYFYPGTTVVHGWEKGSHKNKTLFKYHIKSMKYYFDKWGWKII